MYMLDSDQEPSYNLSKNLVLLSRILMLIEGMVDESTSPFSYTTCLFEKYFFLKTVKTFIKKIHKHI